MMKRRQFRISNLAILAFALAVPFASCSKGNSDHASEEVNHTDHGHTGHDHSGLISLDSHTAADFGVATEKASKTDFADMILVSGRIEPKASDESVATATRSGILTLNNEINSGVRVMAGTPIGSIQSAGVQGGDPTRQANAARDAAKRELDRITPLYHDGIVSTQAYNNALAAFEQADAALKSTRQGSASVTCPKGGTITRLLAKSGDYVEAGQRIAVISGNSNLTLRADVPEKYIAQLATVATANFRPASSEKTYSLKDLDGKILTNTLSAMAENGYIPVYFSFSNDGTVAPGTFAEVYLESDTRHDVISVPKDAIVEINGNKCIYTRHDEDLYEKHLITIGATDGSRIEVLSGLETGAEVVVKGAQVIRMAETSATAVPGHTHNH